MEGEEMKSEKTDFVLEISGLTKVFSDFWRRAKVKAVDNLDLNVRRGEVFGLLGPNGSGKSTTIKIILGLLHPTSGAISVFNKAPGNVGIKKKIGYLPEESYLYNYLTPRETLDFYARLFDIGRQIRGERIDQLLDMAGLTHAADRPVGEFSKGMARRVGLAQALINNPELVVLDEPTSGLDPIGCRQVKDLILALARQGKTVILSSHLLADVEDVCDRIAILYNGSIHAHGMVNELLKVDDSSRFTMPVLSSDQTKTIINLIKEKTGAMPQVDHPSRDLEQFFLDVVEQAHGDAAYQSGVARSGNLPEYLNSSH
ncbi:MAG: ABC transporter ATP-binding protein [Kiritimatiellae bacterium]|nr:ABC transporter ATP-binding protein [Kiritimatiellia bacterium]